MAKSPRRVKGKVINSHTGQMQCPVCGQVWSPNQEPGMGKLYYGAARCPNDQCSGIEY